MTFVNWKASLVLAATVIGSLAGVAAVAAVLGYNTASSENAALRRDLDFATNSKGIVEALENIKRLSDASNNVFRFEEHAKQVAELQTNIDKANFELKAALLNVDKYKMEVKSLVEELRERERNILELKNILDVKYSIKEDFVIDNKSSKEFLGGELIVGVTSIFSTFVDVQTPAGQNNLYVGGSTEWVVNDAVCKLTLTQIKARGESAHFKLICQK